MDELIAVYNDLGAAGFEIVEVMLTAFIRFEPDYAKQVGEIIIRKRKGALYLSLKTVHLVHDILSLYLAIMVRSLTAVWEQFYDTLDMCVSF